MNFLNVYEEITVPFSERPMMIWFEGDEKKNCNAEGFRAFTDSAAAYLEKVFSDIPKGHWIGLKSRNHPMWYPVFFALEKIGYPVLLLDENIDSLALESFCRQAKLAGIVSEKDESTENIICCKISDILFSSCEKPENICWEYRVAFCTSGTTGNAKIFVFHADSVIEQSRRVRESLISQEKMLSEIDVSSCLVIQTLPQRHCLGFGLTMLVLPWGLSVILPEKEGIFSVADTCRKHGVFCLCTVPAIWKGLFRMAQARFGNCGSESMHKLLGEKMLLAVSAGARLNETLWEKAMDSGLTFLNGWGMTETGFVSIGNISDDKSVDYVGKLVGGHETEILSPDENNFGELAVNGSIVYQSVLVDGEEISRDRSEFYRTGDIFSLDDGRYYFRGRRKSVLIREDGENIYLDELESHFSFLENEQFCVFEHNEQPALVFYSQKDVTEEITDKLRTVNYSLPVQKRISKFYCSNIPLPMTSKGETARYYMSSYISENSENIREIVLYRQ